MALTVVALERVPVGVRGDLSRWMIQPATGVFVGDLTAIVRALIWDRLCSYKRTGACVMVCAAANEQGFEVRQHGDRSFLPIDMDGLALIARPTST